MKSLLLIFSLFSMLSFCSKEESQIKDKLIGEWTWVESSGGFAGKIETPSTTGKEITIEFSSEKYIKYVNGDIESEMTYTIEKGSSIRTTEETYLIVYENGKKQSVELIDNKLILYDECHDCYQNEYVRK